MGISGSIASAGITIKGINDIRKEKNNYCQHLLRNLSDFAEQKNKLYKIKDCATSGDVAQQRRPIKFAHLKTFFIFVGFKKTSYITSGSIKK